MAVDFTQAEKDRERIIRERQQKTAEAFERMKQKIDAEISEMNMSTVSERVRRQQLEELRNELEKQLQRYYSDLEAGLKSDMVSVGESVLSDSEAFFNSLGMPLAASITSFPVEIMENIINGSVYNEQWFLSSAIWGDYHDKLGDINEIVMQGIGMNLSSLEIAKQLQQFVDPDAMKPSAAIVTPCLQDPITGKLYSMDYVKRHPEKDWSGFKETKSRFYYGKVDYNAQRLARTLVAHAYQQNIVKQAQANPFASGVKWIASGGERMCEICEERDGKVFPVDDVPLDHPNGMCTFAVETPSMMEMSNILADWVNGDPTPYDDQLNAWYEGRPIDHKEPTNADQKRPQESEERRKMREELKAHGNSDEDIDEYFAFLDAQQAMPSFDPADYLQLTERELQELSKRMDITEEYYRAIYSHRSGYVMTGNSFRINSALRSMGRVIDQSEFGKLGLPPDTLEAMKKLDAVIGANKLEKSIRAFRMVGHEFLQSTFGLSETEAYRLAEYGAGDSDPGLLSRIVGTRQSELAYMSVSAVEGQNVFGSRNVRLNILIPEGTHCYVTDNADESEIILGRGTKYEVTGMHRETVRQYGVSREIMVLDIVILP